MHLNVPLVLSYSHSPFQQMAAIAGNIMQNTETRNGQQ